MSTDRPDTTESPYTVDAGLTYALGTGRQLDLGLRLGLTRAADDIGAFVGYSVRM